MTFINKTGLIVPSRGRPENIKRLSEALLDTNSFVHLYVGVDSDDETLDGYLEYEDVYGFSLIVNEKRERFGPTLNRIAIDIVDSYDYIGWMGDDHEPKSWEWDLSYRLELYKLGVGIVYGDDLVMGESIATQLTMTSNIIKTLGYAVPEGFTHLYIDNYFMELGKSIDRLRYLPDVIVQHHHPCAGTAKEDRTYMEANSPENWTNDRIRFDKYMKEELSRDAEKLKGLL
jgi:hypothetical protein